MKRRLIISEEEKNRILNLHETRKNKEWNLIGEQVTGNLEHPLLVQLRPQHQLQTYLFKQHQQIPQQIPQQTRQQPQNQTMKMEYIITTKIMITKKKEINIFSN